MASDNLLERAFMARIRADEYREKLAKLREEFESSPEVMELNLSIERGGRQHLLLIGLDGEARFGDTQMGCIAVVPVEVA